MNRQMLEKMYGIKRGDALPTVICKMAKLHNGDVDATMLAWRMHQMDRHFAMEWGDNDPQKLIWL